MKILQATSALAVMAWTIWYARKHPIFGFSIFFIIFSFTWRLFAAAFLDIFGPVYAIELFAEVGGNGGSLLFAATLLATLLVFRSVLAVEKLRAAVGPPRPPVPRGAITLGDALFLLAVLFVVAMYVDFLRRGTIPLLEGMERGVYTAEHAGPLHKWFMDFSNFVAFGLGVAAIYPRFRGGHTDLRFVAILAPIFVYCVLTGHRFSIFFAMTTFFVMPRAALYVPPPERFAGAPPVTWLRRMMVSRTVRWTLAFLLAVGVTGALVNSYLNTRAFAPGLAVLSAGQRILIQPSEMWFETYERVILRGEYDPMGAAVFVFVDPIDPTRATSIQYLMAKSLGQSTATAINAAGTAYNGGYPEIFFEMLGPVFAWAAILLVSYAAAYLMRELLLAVCQGRLLSSFAVLYILYSFLLTFGGGMLNFLVAYTFWVKLAFMFFCLYMEKLPSGRVRPILPWVIWSPASAATVPVRS